MVNLISMGSLFDTIFFIGADLDGVIFAEKKFFEAIIFATKLFQVFGDEISMIKSTGTDVAVDGWEGNDNDFAVYMGQNAV